VILVRRIVGAEVWHEGPKTARRNFLQPRRKINRAAHDVPVHSDFTTATILMIAGMMT
jgi:hypothetical protein